MFMLALWQIHKSDIRRLQGDDRQFTEFLNSLLRATAAGHGIPDCKVRTTIRTNIPDGGIDAAIDVTIPDDTTGSLQCPTAWQFKAQAYKTLGKTKEAKKGGRAKAEGSTRKRKDVALKWLRDQVQNSYAKNLITRGYAYRLVICDGMPANTKEKWTEALWDEALKLSANAQQPMVLTEDDLAQWANRFPSVCIEFFRPGLGDLDFQVFSEWQAETRKVVPVFVAPPGADRTIQQLAEFADLSKSVKRASLTVQGAAGVGKTRLVCEAMAQSAGTTALIVYTDDEQQAIKLAKHVIANPQCATIIIADECGVSARVDIAKILETHASRARAICIDNTLQRPPNVGEEIILEQPPQSTAEVILERNFPGIPQSRRRAFTVLSRGFIRLAVDLCQRSDLIPEGGPLDQVANGFYEAYLSKRLDDNQRKAIEVISLVGKIGFKAEVDAELDQFGKICGTNRQNILEAAISMKDAPGFVTFAGRYLYITPQIISIAAFQRAWQVHIQPDPEGFLNRLPADFVERFHKQVEACGTPKMRKTVSDFFGQWVSQMTQQDLADEGKVRRLIQLIELQPDLNLSTLKQLILFTPREALKAMHTATGYGRGPRRELVWFCERAMALPEYFNDAEEILLHLALAESEAPNVGNNATHVWRQIFWPMLSGTAIPFNKRAGILHTRLFADDVDIMRLASDALGGVFSSLWGHGMRMAGQAVIMGRIPPDEWRPHIKSELEDCWRLPVALLVECSNSSNQDILHTAQRIAVENLRNLIPGGFFDELKMILAQEKLPNDLLPKLFENVDFMLKHDANSPNMRHELLAEVEAWRSSLMPQDFHARIVAAVGQQMIGHHGDAEDATWNTEIAKLAQELLADCSLLQENLKWLCSEEARSAPALGVALGKLDKDAQLIKTIMDAIDECHSTTFAVGYLSGLLSVSPAHASTLNTLLDSLVERSPRDAFQLITAGGDLVHGFERVTKLVGDGQLGIEYLRTFDVGISDGQGQWRKLTKDEMLAVLRLYAGANTQNNKLAIDAGVHFLWSQTMPLSGHDPEEIFSNQAMAELARKIFSASAETGGYYWREAIIRLLPFDSHFVIKTSIYSMLEGNVVAAREAVEALAAAARGHPEAVLEALIPYIHDRKAMWKFRVLKYGDIVRNLSTSAIAAWLDKVGVVGAKALARSLPAPYLDDKQIPVVPEQTLTVLRRFGDDQEVFNEFCIGLHSFQMYSGNIAAQHMREAEIARAFINHDMDVIRRWARQEITHSEKNAQRERQEQEELGI